MAKAKIFKRLRVINLLMQRAYHKCDFEKFEKLEKRAKLIIYHLDNQPIINRDILIKK